MEILDYMTLKRAKSGLIYLIISRRQEGKGGEEAEGVAGTTALLMDEQISDQPVSGFQWNAEKRGLFCCIALDQCLRVSMVTNMHVV